MPAATARCLVDALLARVVAHLLRQLHAAELRPAHRAEVRDLRAVGRQRLVVVRARGHRIERQVELILPAELEPRLRQRIVPLARARMALREIGGVRGDLVGDHARLHVVAVRQAEVLLRRDVAEHRRAVPADHRRADRRRDVVVAGRDVGRERAERVERRLVAPFELLLHVLLDEMHGDVAGAFVHHLDVVLPGDAASARPASSARRTAPRRSRRRSSPGRRPSPSENETS